MRTVYTKYVYCPNFRNVCPWCLRGHETVQRKKSMDLLLSTANSWMLLREENQQCMISHWHSSLTLNCFMNYEE